MEKVTVSYGSPWGQPQIVTDALGTARNYSFQTILGVPKSTGVSQVGDAVAQMDQVTQQNAALVEEAAAAAESLKSQAHELVQAVSVFQLTEAQN